MKKYFSFFLIVFASIPLLVNAQSYIDPNYNVEAKSFSYQLTTAPVIDGDTTEWANIPWQEAYYNDRDFNEDLLLDPMSNRKDYRGRWKSAWVMDSSKIYFLLETFDDVIYTNDSVKTTHRDGISIRLDPNDEEVGGEPGDDASKTSWNMRFQIDSGENSAYEGNDGVKPDYKVYAVVDSSVFPVHTYMEVALELPYTITDSDIEMGFHILFNDNDPEDDSPNSKNTVPVQWPQCYIEQATASTDGEFVDDNNRLYPDEFWRNDYYWGNIDLIALNIVEVSAGSSIQSAINSATEGTIIKIAAGTYTENIEITQPYITLEGASMADGDTTWIVPSTITDPAIIVSNTDDEAAGTVIKNIAFDGLQSDSSYATTGIEIGSAQTLVLGNYFTGFANPVTEATVDSGEAYACVLEDNTVDGCDNGLDFCSPSTVIRYNTIKDNTGGYGVNAYDLEADNSIDIAFNDITDQAGQCAIGYGGAGVFTIHHNYMTRSIDLWGAGDSNGDDGIENQDEGGSTDYLYNNTIVGWKSDGVQLGGSSAGTSNFYMRNNIIAYNAGNDYDIRSTGSYDIGYSLSYDNGTDIIDTLSSAVSCLVSNPVFTDEDEDDYTIQTTSPAVDAGENEPFSFKVMYFDNAVDMGAYETGEPTPVTGISSKSNTVASTFVLNQNYPNPFNPTTKISFSLTKAGNVTLKVYNILGQEVRTLVNEELTAGEHVINFNGAGLASGIYFYSIKAGDFTATKKMMLLK